MKIEKNNFSRFVRSAFLIILSLDAVIGMHCLFTNIGYSHNLYILKRLFDIFMTVLMALYIMAYRASGNIRRKNIFIIILIFVYFLYSGIEFKKESSISPYTMVTLFRVIFLFFLDDFDLRQIFHCIAVEFAFVLFPGIIVTLCKYLGIDLVYNVILPTEDQQIYHTYYNYFGSLMLHENDTYWRLCGIFNEPGVIGTFGGLLLCADNFEFRKKWYNLVIAVAGIMSLSTAFFMICLIYCLIRTLVINPSIKKYMLFVLFFMFFIFIDYALSRYSPEYKRFFHDKVFQLILSGKSNRTKDAFEQVYKDLWVSSDWLFGCGTGSAGGYSTLSYKDIIYEQGVFGLGVFAILLISIYRSIRKKTEVTMSFFLIYIISLYQRPYTLEFFALVILYTGLIHSQMTTKNQSL